ncbi:MAG: hypothetical protein NZ610_04520 [Candidatus Bipolaricaulota bacterium]|nr:hypothetical protein [Candidatus Bipolaricaulota bacterium]MCS7274655.1 hypothetical protein [Candidatus Bipolaricaulota bacterium]MDW8110914.1 hypothetical protein [Candidatus Bipolaricaulota bacterium]MDW8329125.1 hypothetical protein [Candidatus Bipolaricaulota bacterium]
MKDIQVPWLGSRVKSLELELKILRAKLAQSAQDGKPLSSLYGLLKGQSESTFEEIQETEYRGIEQIP